MDFSNENILTLIPQRPPFVMVDKLIYWNELCSRTTFLIDHQNILCANGKLTAAGLIENMAQTAAAGAGYAVKKMGLPVLEGYIGAIQDLEIYKLPNVGETIETEVIVDNKIFDVTMISGRVNLNDEILAVCRMKIFLAPEKTI